MGTDIKMQAVHKYYVTFKDGENFGTYAVVYSENADKAFEIATKEFGWINVSNIYTEHNWKYKYTMHLRFLKEVNPEYYNRYQTQRSRRRTTW